MDLLLYIKSNSNGEIPRWRVKYLVGLSHPQFLHGIVGGKGRELINSWEDVTDGLFCKLTSLVEAFELSQHMIFFE